MPKSANRGKRNKRRRAREEAYRTFGPDQSTVVHDFGDGWSIRHLQTQADLRVEGALLHHCLGTWTTRLQIERWCRVEEGPAGLRLREVDDDRPHIDLYSVRDVDNHPRATFQHWPPDATMPYGWTGTPVGHGDTTPVGLGYARRILEWHASLPYTVVLDNGRWPDEIIFYPERETRAAAGRVRRSDLPLVGVSP